MKQMMRCRGMGTSQYLAYRFHGVPAPAAGEAAPQAAVKINAERGGVVAAVKRARAGKPSSPSHEPFVEPVEGEHIADSDP